MPSTYAILHTMWPAPSDNLRPWWAELAYTRGWLTFSQYEAIEPTEPSPMAVLYEKLAFQFAEIAKRAG